MAFPTSCTAWGTRTASHSAGFCRLSSPASFAARYESKRRYKTHAMHQSADGGESEAEERKALAAQRRLLERSFLHSGTDSSSAGDAGGPADPSLIHSLPLWRVQWVVLPGYQSVVHVHVPHYVDLFERLLASPRPWRFGHLYLPGGSRSLGTPEYALAAGTQAPLVGTLMEILQAVRFPDGRLLVLAAGLSRFRVVRPLQELPYSIADVALLPDAEEAEQQEPLASQRLTEAARAEGLPLMVAMRAVGAAAQQAAAAAARAWQDYELSEAQVLDRLAVIDGTDEAEAQAFGRRLVEISHSEFLPLPYWSLIKPLATPDTSSWEAAGADLADAGLAAQAAALAAVEVCLAEGLASASNTRSTGGGGGGSSSGSSTFGTEQAGSVAAGEGIRGINSTAERGVAWRPAAEVLWEGEEAGVFGSAPSSSLDVAVQLEGRVWEEVAAISGLMEKVNQRPWQLPEGLHCLRPPPAAAAAAGASSQAGAAHADDDWGDSDSEEEEEDGSSSSGGLLKSLPHGRAHHAYPALRRAQRLSFALCNGLPAFSGNEPRQAVLEAESTTARLRLVLAGLRMQRTKLAAVAALKGLSVPESP